LHVLIQISASEAYKESATGTEMFPLFSKRPPDIGNKNLTQFPSSSPKSKSSPAESPVLRFLENFALNTPSV